jgi:AhpD family alkylhydroperoxidase
MNKAFNRRIYNISSFKVAVADLLANLDDLRAARRGGRVSRAFAERIMLAVTQVNGCRYCQFGHARAALRAGVTPEEIQFLTTGRLAELPAEEVTALFFAQHYAETVGRPGPDAWQHLVDTYGPDKAQDIVAYIRMITMGNLLGNTFDAFLSRLAWRPAPYSSLFQELGVLLGIFVIIPAGLFRRVLATI